MSWFNQGYSKVEERDKEIKEAMSRSFLPQLFVREEDEDVFISFITADPITFYEHFIPAQKRSYTCPDNGDTSKGTCPMCAMGNKPSFRGAYLVIDHRYEEFKNKQDELVKQQHTLKIAKFGIRVLKQLQKTDAKLKKGSAIVPPVANGILGIPFEIVRSGGGTDTAYTFNALQPNPEHFPRKYEIGEKDGKKQTETELIVEAIKPLSREALLEKIGGVSTNYASTGSENSRPSYGQPIHFGLEDNNDAGDVIEFSS
jgi:hypothetical protein